MDMKSGRGRILLILAVLFPVAILGLLVVQKARIYADGVEVQFPISGYDPRDIIAGHYLVYQVDYGAEDLCSLAESIAASNRGTAFAPDEASSETNGGSRDARVRSQPDEKVPACLCLTDVTETPPVSYTYDCAERPPSDCAAILKGSCRRGRFTAGLERYYINEGKARELDRIVRQGNSRIVVKIDRSGTGLVYSLVTP